MAITSSLTGWLSWVMLADSITIHFGGDPKQLNYLSIMDGWNLRALSTASGNPRRYLEVPDTSTGQVM